MEIVNVLFGERTWKPRNMNVLTSIARSERVLSKETITCWQCKISSANSRRLTKLRKMEMRGDRMSVNLLFFGFFGELLTELDVERMVLQSNRPSEIMLRCKVMDLFSLLAGIVDAMHGWEGWSVMARGDSWLSNAAALCASIRC